MGLRESLVIAGAVIIAGVIIAGAIEAAAPRYSLTDIRAGSATRLDLKTGAMSECTDRNARWTCP